MANVPINFTSISTARAFIVRVLAPPRTQQFCQLQLPISPCNRGIHIYSVPYNYLVICGHFSSFHLMSMGILVSDCSHKNLTVQKLYQHNILPLEISSFMVVLINLNLYSYDLNGIIFFWTSLAWWEIKNYRKELIFREPYTCVFGEFCELAVIRKVSFPWKLCHHHMILIRP